MGNTTSDPLDHSLKRLRLSHTEQLSLTSPCSTSPRRKVVTNIIQDFGRISNNPVNDTNDRSPVLLCDDNTSASLTARLSKPIINTSCNEKITLNKNVTSRVESSARPNITNQDNDSKNEELTDEQIMITLRSVKFISDLSDLDIIDCLKHEYLSTSH
ncbi:unnamed protein product [Rotaria sp. Silwood1]|nr:unnamed protein product [Rotaria sp. Silwood1]CAF1689784.1 unnamed protein product [Rotaria sp. Silwood1]